MSPHLDSWNSFLFYDRFYLTFYHILTKPRSHRAYQLGAIILGVMSDAYGRRPAFQLATLLVVLFGLLTTFATGFWWLLIFRTLVGVGAGGMEVPFDLLGEIVTHKEKSRCVLLGFIQNICFSTRQWWSTSNLCTIRSRGDCFSLTDPDTAQTTGTTSVIRKFCFCSLAHFSPPATMEQLHNQTTKIGRCLLVVV